MITSNLLMLRTAAFFLVSQLLIACDSDLHSTHAEHSGKAQAEKSLIKVLPVRWELSQTTDKKLFSAHFSCDEKPYVGDFQVCYLALKREDETVLDANISIDGGMKAHGHGLPTSPKVSATGIPGKYKIEGLKFSMPGEWIIGFKVVLDQPKLSDQVIFTLSI
jgi:hypothetical protein